MTVALTGTPVLTTERLILRAPQASDFGPWLDFMRSDRAQFVRPPVLDDGVLWRAFGHVVGHWVMRGYGQFVITDRVSGAVLGAAGPWHPAGWPEAELGWTLWSEAAEGRGIAREAVTAARAHAYGVLGWPTAVSYIDPANTRSQALARRLGCHPDPQAARPGEDVAVWRHPAPGAAP